MDRKAWIIIILCCIALGVNFHLSNKNSLARAEYDRKMRDAAAAQKQAEAANNPVITNGQTQPAVPVAPTVTAETVVFKTDRSEFTITNLGGGIASVKMITDNASTPVTVNDHAKAPIGAFVTYDSIDPTGLPIRTPETKPYQFLSKTEKQAVLQGELEPGISVTKSYTLSEGTGSDPHLLRVKVSLRNNSENAWKGEQLSLYSGVANELEGEAGYPPSFFWMASGDAHELQPSHFKKWLRSLNPEFYNTYKDLQWAGVMNRYYATIMSLKQPAQGWMWSQRIAVDASKFQMHGGLGLPDIVLEKGAEWSLEYDLYTGPKEYKRLRELGNDWKDVMFYGMFSWISRGMTNLMTMYHGLTFNWGWAIVLMTITIRILIWPIHNFSQKSMKKLSALNPKMTEIREKFRDNPTKMNQEMMKLYRTAGVNPMSGCLPILIQIPIFFGFFSVLRYAAELRGEHWILWVHDLSLPDTVGRFAGFNINPLPIIMTITSFFQMQMMPKTGDPTQRRIFMMMPFVFLIFCYSFGSGLALYWTVQNIFSIFQTWITKKLSKEEAPAGGVIDTKAEVVTDDRPKITPAKKPHRKKR